MSGTELLCGEETGKWTPDCWIDIRFYFVLLNLQFQPHVIDDPAHRRQLPCLFFFLENSINHPIEITFRVQTVSILKVLYSCIHTLRRGVFNLSY